MASVPPSYDEVTKQNCPPYPTPTQPPYPTAEMYPNQPPIQQTNVTYPPYPPNESYQAGAPPIQVAGVPYQGYGTGDQYSSDFTSFSDKSIRHAFIRKVYMIMTAQLLVTCLFIAVLQFVSSIKFWVQNNPWFYYLSYAVFIVTYITLVCCPSVRRRYPGNFICLAVFTFAFSYLTGTIASFYNTPGVLSAIAITTVVCVSITIFALQTKIDFTMCSGLILVVSLVFILTGLTCLIIYVTIGSSKVLHGLYAGIGILLFGLYLIYDTQLIIGGHKYELSEEDYIEGALQLYLDIVNMFLLILSLFGSKN